MPRSRMVSFGSDSDSDLSDYEVSRSRSRSRGRRNTSAGRDTYPRRAVQSKSSRGMLAPRWKLVDDSKGPRWRTMMNGRYAWFGAFIVAELVNVIVPAWVWFRIVDTGNPARMAEACAKKDGVNFLMRAGREFMKHTYERHDQIYYPIIAVFMIICALYVCVLLALMRSTRNVPMAIGVKVMQVALCIFVGIYEMIPSDNLIEAANNMFGWDRGYTEGMPAYFCLAVLNMCIAAMLWFAFFWQSEQDADDRVAERRALRAEAGRSRYEESESESEDDADVEYRPRKSSRKSRKSSRSSSGKAKKNGKEVYPSIQSPAHGLGQNYVYTTAVPGSTYYQVQQQPQPMEYTTTTRTIDVNQLPSRVENGQTIYSLDLNQQAARRSGSYRN